jgi:hypothetical protein
VYRYDTTGNVIDRPITVSSASAEVNMMGGLNISSSGAAGITIDNTLNGVAWTSAEASFNGITWTQSDTSAPGTTGTDGNKFAGIIVNNTSASNTTPIPKMDFSLRTPGTGGYMKEAMSISLRGTATSAMPVSASINGDLFVESNINLAGDLNAYGNIEFKTSALGIQTGTGDTQDTSYLYIAGGGGPGVARGGTIYVHGQEDPDYSGQIRLIPGSTKDTYIGSTTANGLFISGATSAAGGLTVDGNVTLGNASSDAVAVSGTAQFYASPRILSDEPVLRIKSTSAASGAANVGYIQFTRATDGEISYIGRKSSDPSGEFQINHLGGNIKISPSSTLLIAGNTSASGNLTVNGNSTLAATSASSLYSAGTITAVGNYVFNNPSNSIQFNNGSMILWNPDAGSMAIRALAIDRITFTSAGDMSVSGSNISMPNIPAGVIASGSNLGLDVAGKIVKATVSGGSGAINNWETSTAYTSGQPVSYNSSLFRATSAHTSTTAFNADLNAWASVDANVLIVNKNAHGFANLTPIFFNGTAWTSAGATTDTTLATHVVLGSNTNYFLASESGLFTLTSHGKTIGSTYYANAGTASTTPTIYSNPIFQVLDANTVEILSHQPATYNNAASTAFVMSVVTRTSSYTTGTSEQYIRYIGTGGDIETIPVATGSGRMLTLDNASLYDWTISGTINGNTSIDLPAGNSIGILDAASTVWRVI